MNACRMSLPIKYRSEIIYKYTSDISKSLYATIDNG